MNQQSGWFAPPPPQRPRGPETHVLTVKQEPERAKAVVRGKEKDRKPIDPPPIIQLEVYDQYPQSLSTMYVHNPHYFCCCSLWDGQRDEPKKSESGQPLLVGSTVSSLHRLKDLQNREGGYFVFGDVSAGLPGRYRLRFSLYEMNPREGTVKYLRSVVSQAFDVASQKDWDGVKESTSLSRSFADQGVRLRLRKESRNSAKRTFAPPFTATPSAPHTPATAARISQSGSYESHSSDEDAVAHGEPALKRPRSIPQSHSMSSDYSSRYPPHSQGGYPAPYSYGGGQYSGYPQSAYGSTYTPGALRTPQGAAMPSYGQSYHSSNMPMQAHHYPSQVTGGYSHSQYGAPSYPPAQSGQAPVSYYGSQHQSPQDQQQRTPSGYSFGSSYGGQPSQPSYYASQPQYDAAPSSMLPSSGAINVRPMANPASTPTLAPINRPNQSSSEQVIPSVESETGQPSHH